MTATPEYSKGQCYIGRFAPSPSGPLHFGSLVCAVASYLDAKANHGKWLVRIEDIDPPREQAGASEHILATLKQHGLQWDETPSYQSQHAQRYNQILHQLSQSKLSYACNCTRKRLNNLQHIYDGHCITAPPREGPAAIRLNINEALNQNLLTSASIDFDDPIQGTVRENLLENGDFIIHRKDGLYAYQLAVVVDDLDQKITHVLRGQDLLDTTPRQIFMMNVLGCHAPQYTHNPLVMGNNDQKLSKQNHAPALIFEKSSTNLFESLKFLGMSPPHFLQETSCEAILKWGVEHWNVAQITKNNTPWETP